jgi:hypothetical protein
VNIFNLVLYVMTLFAGAQVNAAEVLSRVSEVQWIRNSERKLDTAIRDLGISVSDSNSPAIIDRPQNPISEKSSEKPLGPELNTSDLNPQIDSAQVYSDYGGYSSCQQWRYRQSEFEFYLNLYQQELVKFTDILERFKGKSGPIAKWKVWQSRIAIRNLSAHLFALVPDDFDQENYILAVKIRNLPKQSEVSELLIGSPDSDWRSSSDRLLPETWHFGASEGVLYKKVSLNYLCSLPQIYNFTWKIKSEAEAGAFLATVRWNDRDPVTAMKQLSVKTCGGEDKMNPSQLYAYQYLEATLARSQVKLQNCKVEMTKMCSGQGQTVFGIYLEQAGDQIFYPLIFDGPSLRGNQFTISENQLIHLSKEEVEYPKRKALLQIETSGLLTHADTEITGVQAETFEDFLIWRSNKKSIDCSLK